MAKQVREAETEIRKKYPEAAYIELEPDSSTYNKFALDQFQTPTLRKVTPPAHSASRHRLS